jgi:hypothetical protein
VWVTSKGPWKYRLFPAPQLIERPTLSIEIPLQFPIEEFSTATAHKAGFGVIMLCPKDFAKV